MSEGDSGTPRERRPRAAQMSNGGPSYKDVSDDDAEEDEHEFHDNDDPKDDAEDSDFDVGGEDDEEDEAEDDEDGRRGDADGSFDSDDSRPSRRKQPSRKRKPTPPLTDMRRKLRQRGEDGLANIPSPTPAERPQRGAAATRGAPEDGTGGESAERSEGEARSRGAGEETSGPDDEGAPWDEDGGSGRRKRGGDDDDAEDDGDDGSEQDPMDAVPVRERTDEEVEEEMEEVKDMWEMASVLEFLHLFRPQLDLRTQFTAEELERDLVSNIGLQGLLVEVHKSLLGIITPRTAIPDAEWQRHLAKQIYREWEAVGGEGDPPLRTGKGVNPAVDYAALSSTTRVLVLKALVDISLDYGDVAERLEEALRVTRLNPKSQAALLNAKPKRGAPPVELIEEFRRLPLGTDAVGRAYWWLDMGNSMGFRLYRHVPPPPSRVRAMKRRVWDPPGKWEVAATSLDELKVLLEDLSQSKKKPDRQVLEALDGIVVELTARIEKQERARKSRERLRLNIGVVLDDGFARRSTRTRKEVKYTFDDFDDLINGALRDSRRSARADAEQEASGSRRAASPPAVMGAEEAIGLGLRRGRSARGVDPYPDYDDSGMEDCEAPAEENSEQPSQEPLPMEKEPAPEAHADTPASTKESDRKEAEEDGSGRQPGSFKIKFKLSRPTEGAAGAEPVAKTDPIKAEQQPLQADMSTSEVASEINVQTVPQDAPKAAAPESRPDVQPATKHEEDAEAAEEPPKFPVKEDKLPVQQPEPPKHEMPKGMGGGSDVGEWPGVAPEPEHRPREEVSMTEEARPLLQLKEAAPGGSAEEAPAKAEEQPKEEPAKVPDEKPQAVKLQSF